jgi:hypothetical protein
MTQTSEEVRPHSDKGYVDQFWSGMFSTFCSFAQTEARLIWMRYSAFLVVHGLLFNFVKDHLADRNVLLGGGVAGLFVCGVWAFLNYCGWVNLYFYLWHASRLKFFNLDASVPLMLPTDSFIGETQPRPKGSVYRTAQLLPLFFGAIDCIGIYEGAHKITSNTIVSSAIALLAGLIALGLVAVFCRKLGKGPTFLR